MNICLSCNNILTKKHQQKFCCRSCSVKFNNKLRKVKLKNCLYCNILLEHKDKTKFCSLVCNNNFKRKQLFLSIENEKCNSVNSIKKYLINKQGNKCSECGWCKVNPITNKVPIELEHIDGDSTNNKLNNLKLLCPNCHSLTPTYKALNIGKGRHSRRLRYKENKSY